MRRVYGAIWFLWPLASIAAFAITIRIDEFAIFGSSYRAIWIFLLPAALILLAIGLAAFTGKAPRRAWRYALLLWIPAVAYGHRMLIAVAAASV